MLPLFRVNVPMPLSVMLFPGANFPPSVTFTAS
jgi:hypothetical protein